MMDTDKMIDKLSSLVKLDLGAIDAYEQAISQVDLPEVKERLRSFRDDHQRHVDDLSEAIRRIGGEPPEPKGGIGGTLLQGFTAIRGITGTEGVLKAMKTNENLTNNWYDDALQWDLPEDLKSVVRRNREDERRHLEYIESAISQRVWERPAA